ncbi:hypothetical protein F5878DRAFT_662871 [Lentinula raphanica]|uniref:Uncharacterized protein n=1 Tax=Lentinula raphanica TaxID=153919 RepID=A0AA38P584_9AGAR|nr:hypothetical protein F5878DRAFT_662871 [Lentinula raphanica]
MLKSRCQRRGSEVWMLMKVEQALWDKKAEAVEKSEAGFRSTKPLLDFVFLLLLLMFSATRRDKLLDAARSKHPLATHSSSPSHFVLHAQRERE